MSLLGSSVEGSQKMPLPKIDTKTLNGIRELLDEVHRAHGFEQVESAIGRAVTAIESVPDNLRVPALNKAVGKGIRRFRAAATVIARCTQVPQIDEWIVAALRDPDRDQRDWMVQVIGNQRLVRFAPEINRVIR